MEATSNCCGSRRRPFDCGCAAAEVLTNAVLDATYDRAPDVTDVQIDTIGVHEPALNGHARIALPVVNGVAEAH